MGILANCPPAAELPDIGTDECPESVGQIQKIVYQRVFSTGSTKNKFVIGTANPNVLASWTPLLAASDGTKVVPSPFVQAPNTETGAARTYGGGNDTLGGIEINIGREPTSFTGNFLAVKQAIIKAMKQYQGENVGVYLIDEYGQIIGLTDDPDSPTDFLPIPIKGLFIGDKNFGGLEEADMNTISWYFLPNWSDNLHIVAPATGFDPLNEIVAP